MKTWLGSYFESSSLKLSFKASRFDVANFFRQQEIALWKFCHSFSRTRDRIGVKSNHASKGSRLSLVLTELSSLALVFIHVPRSRSVFSARDVFLPPLLCLALLFLFVICSSFRRKTSSFFFILFCFQFCFQFLSWKTKKNVAPKFIHASSRALCRRMNTFLSLVMKTKEERVSPHRLCVKML